MSSFKSSDDIKETEDGPYRGFGYLNLISDRIKLEKRENYCNLAFLQDSRRKDWLNQKGLRIYLICLENESKPFTNF